MARSGLRSAAAKGAEAHPPEPTPAQAVGISSDEDGEGIAADASRSRPPPSRQLTTSKRRTRQNGGQVRSGGLGSYEGRLEKQFPSKKRGAVEEVYLASTKRRPGLRSGGTEAPLVEPTEPTGDDLGDEGADRAPIDPKFYHTIIESSRAGLGKTAPPTELQNGSREADDQLQQELRDRQLKDDLYEFASSDDDAGDSGKQQPQKNRQQRTASEDLATPDEEQAEASQTPGGRRDGDADKEDINREGDGDEQRGEGQEEQESDEESGGRETISITSDGLRGMLKLMGRRGWTNQGGKYADELLPQDDESEKEWLDRNGSYLKGEGRCERLYAEVHHLLKLWQGVPTFADLDKQAERLGKQREAIKEAVAAIQASIDGIVAYLTKPKPKPARNGHKRWRSAKEGVVKSLYLRIIPLLVLCLKQAFLLGTDAAMETDTLGNGQFIACTIRPQLVIAKWTAFLYNVLQEELENTSPRAAEDMSRPEENLSFEARQRDSFGKQLRRFQKSLRRANEELKFRASAPRRRQQAIENDRRAAAAREERERSVREARDRQMQAFVESTWRMRAAQPRDEYYEKHGWYLQEDEKVLKTMQESAWPDFVGLQARLPQRTLEELVRRVDKLRDSSRRKHEARGVQPPWWCYAPGTRL